MITLMRSVTILFAVGFFVAGLGIAMMRNDGYALGWWLGGAIMGAVVFVGGDIMAEEMRKDHPRR